MPSLRDVFYSGTFYSERKFAISRLINLFQIRIATDIISIDWFVKFVGNDFSLQVLGFKAPQILILT